MRCLLLAAIIALASPRADARSEKVLAYPRTDAWSAAVRFIRVDAHLKVTEKDAEAGYVLFELRDEGKIFRGALELADVTQDGRHAVRFVMTIEDRPSYVETELLDQLTQKLREELGEPEPPKDEPPKDEAPKDDPKGDGAPKKDVPKSDSGGSSDVPKSDGSTR